MPGLRQFRPGPQQKQVPAVFKIFLSNRKTADPLYTIDMSEVYGTPVLLTTTKGDLREILGGCKQHIKSLTTAQINQEIDFTKLQCQVWLNQPDITNKSWTLRVYVANLALLSFTWLTTGKDISGQAVRGNKVEDMFTESKHLSTYSTGSTKAAQKTGSQHQAATNHKPRQNRKQKGDSPVNNLAGRGQLMDDSAANSRRVSSMSGQDDMPAMNDSNLQVSPAVSLDYMTALEIASLQDLKSGPQRPMAAVNAAPQVASTLSPQQSIVQVERVTQQGVIAASQQPPSTDTNAAQQVAAVIAAQHSMVQVQGVTQQGLTVACQQPPSTAVNAGFSTAIRHAMVLAISAATQQGSTAVAQQHLHAGQAVLQEDSTAASQQQQNMTATDAVTQGLSRTMTHQHMMVTDVVTHEDPASHMQPTGEVQPMEEVRVQGTNSQTTLQHPVQTQVQILSLAWLLRKLRDNKEGIKALFEVVQLLLEARKLFANSSNTRQADRSTNASERARSVTNGRSRSQFVRVICMLVQYYRLLMDPNQGMRHALLRNVALTLIKELYKKAQQHISQQVA